MQDRLDPFARNLITRLVAERAIDEGGRPAIAAGLDAHAIGTQRVKLAQLAVEQDGFEIGVAVEQQIGADRFDERNAGVRRIGPLDEREQRMIASLLAAFIDEPRNGSRRLDHHAHTAMTDGVALIALAGERRAVARGPARAAQGMHGEHFGGARGLCFAKGRRRAEKAREK